MSEDTTHAVDIDDYRLDIESGFGALCVVYGLSIADVSTRIACKKNIINCLCDFESQ